MSVEDVVKLLRIVERSLEEVPRNEYEANNRHLSNVERLAEARQRLTLFSGDRVNELHRQVEALARRNEERKGLSATASAAKLSSGAPGGDAFSLDFMEDAQEGGAKNEAADELARAEEAMSREARHKKEKKARKSEKANNNSGERKKLKEKRTLGDDANKEAARTMKDGTSATPAKEAPQEAAMPTAPPAEPLECVVSRDMEQPSDAVPLALVGHAGVCSLVPNSPMAKVDFPSVTLDVDGTPCYCRVELYRCVLRALVHGTPTAPVDTKPAPQAYTPPAPLPEAAQASEGDADEDVDESMAEDAQGTWDADEREDETARLQELSQDLVLQYEAVQKEKEELEEQSSFPKELPAKLIPSLRGAGRLSWVVLMCLGGYFAGGVFVHGKCVKHKGFQRYVVRKKQGGRQSTSAKGGSYGSIGAQIRMAQEVKWKIEVRDLLLAWRKDIDAAAFILYAAPGPQNRLMLTDFSSLPPTTSTRREESPVKLQDPRVHRVPLTTHRPTMKEVERIYETVSKYNLHYLPVPSV